jgi:hypothetical protein
LTPSSSSKHLHTTNTYNTQGGTHITITKEKQLRKKVKGKNSYENKTTKEKTIMIEH